LDGGEWLWEAKEDGEHNCPEFAKSPGGKEVQDDFFEVVKDESTVFDADNDTGEGF
jgi:hypothetical protein